MAWTNRTLNRQENPVPHNSPQPHKTTGKGHTDTVEQRHQTEKEHSLGGIPLTPCAKKAG